MQTTDTETTSITGFSTAIWHCAFDGRLISYEGNAAFDALLSNAHRKPGTLLHDVFRMCLQHSSARAAIQEFDSLAPPTPPNEAFTRKLQDVMLLDGTFVRQNAIIRPFAGISVIWTEISDIRSEAVKYRRQANHDPLTGLLNGRGFELRIARLQNEQRTLEGARLMLIDLDNFKQVNDTFGHDSGDRVLIHFAECLRQVFGPEAIIARLGGDEFAVLQFDTETESYLDQAEDRLNKLVRDNAYAPGNETGLGISVGTVALSGNASIKIHDWLKSADQKMYAAKKAAKAAPHPHIELECEFHFQPIVDTQAETIVGFEALLRREGETRRDASAKTLIPELNRRGMLARVERDCLAQVVCEYHKLKAQTGRDFEFSVNICQAQWDDPTFAKWLVDYLEVNRIPKHVLRLELLENINVDTADCTVRRNLQTLQTLGIQVDLDDFGMSGASLERLILPAISRVKIPGPMAQAYWDDRSTMRIVNAVLKLSSDLGYRTVIEGIEAGWQSAIFEREGCALFQGRHFAAPMPASELVMWVEKNAPLLKSTRAKRSPFAQDTMRGDVPPAKILAG